MSSDLKESSLTESSENSVNKENTATLEDTPTNTGSITDDTAVKHGIESTPTDSSKDKVETPVRSRKRLPSKKRKADDANDTSYEKISTTPLCTSTKASADILDESEDATPKALSKGSNKKPRVKKGNVPPKLQKDCDVSKQESGKVSSGGKPKTPKTPNEKKVVRSRKQKTPQKLMMQEDEVQMKLSGEKRLLNDESIVDAEGNEADKSAERASMPAMSIKIICTPFSLSKEEKENSIENDSKSVTSKKRPPAKKSVTAKTPVNAKKSVTTKTAVNRKRSTKGKDGVSVPVPEEQVSAKKKKVSISVPASKVAKKGVPEKKTPISMDAIPQNNTDSQVPASKVAKKRAPRKKAPISTDVVPQSNTDSQLAQEPAMEELKKETRGKRKKKESVPYVIDFINESEDDIDVELSEDEYRPSKDEILAKTKLKENGKTNMSSEDEGDKENNKNSNMKFAEKSVKFKFKKGKADTSRNKKSKSASMTDKAKVPSKRLKSPSKRGKGKLPSKLEVSELPSTSDTPKPPTKTKKPNKSPKKIMNVKKAPKQKVSQKPSVENNLSVDLNEEGVDMPLLSPSKGKKAKPPKKKRKVRISQKNTYFDDTADDLMTGEEDFDTASATEEEEADQGYVKKPRKRRRRYGEPFSITGNWYIAQGYLSDIIDLLERFNNGPSWRFKDFAKIWRDMKFSLVYRGRQNFKELLEFSEEIALLTKRYLNPPHNDKTRIGALYTLYGLYYKHPFRHFFKLRLILEEYKNLMDLVNRFKTNIDNPDPAYIFRKLECDGAILHVASSSEMGIDFYNSEREAVDVKYEARRLLSASDVVWSCPASSLDDDNILLSHYHSMKISVGGNGQVPEKALNFVDSSTTAEIIQEMQVFKEDCLAVLRLKEKMPEKFQPANQDSSQLSEIGAKRAEILNKASKADTGSDYLRRKVFGDSAYKQPQQLQAGKNITALKGMSEENQEVMSNTDIRNFMSVTEKETQQSPPKTVRRPRRNVVHKFIKRPAYEEETSPLAGKEAESTAVEESEAMDSDNNNVSGDTGSFSADVLDILSQAPKIPKKPKRLRQPPRIRTLSKAIKREEESKRPQAVGDLKGLYRQICNQELSAKRLKSRSLKSYDESSDKPVVMPYFPILKSDVEGLSDEEMPALGGVLKATRSPGSPAGDLMEDPEMIIGLPDHEDRPENLSFEAKFSQNSQCDPFLAANQNDESARETVGGISPTKNRMLLSENDLANEKLINLVINLKGRHVNDSSHFQISQKHWDSIKTNRTKLDELKSMLKSTLLMNKVTDMDEVDVEISTLEDGNSESLPYDTIGTTKVDSNNVGVSSTHHELQDLTNESCRLVPEVRSSVVSTSKSKGENNLEVVQELQKLWGEDDEEEYLLSTEHHGLRPETVDTDSQEDLFEHVDTDSQEDLFEHVDTDSQEDIFEPSLMSDDESEMFPVTKLNNASSLGADNTSTEESNCIDLVSDADDFEDESEPIILNPTSVSSTFGKPRASSGFFPAVEKSILSLDDDLSTMATVKSEFHGAYMSISPSPLISQSQEPLNRRTSIKSTSPTNFEIKTSPVSNVRSRHPIQAVSKQQSTDMSLGHPSLPTRTDPRLCGTPGIAIESTKQNVRQEIPEAQSSILNQQISVPLSTSSTSPENHLEPVADPHLFQDCPPSSPSQEASNLFYSLIAEDKTISIPKSLSKDSRASVGHLSRVDSEKISTLCHVPVQDTCSASATSSSKLKGDGVPSPSSSKEDGVPSPSSSSDTVSGNGPEEPSGSDLSKSLVSSESKSTVSKVRPGRNVCSFLFSPKFKAKTGIKTTAAEATGKPVKSEKPKVVFMLKRSLVPKRKTL